MQKNSVFESISCNDACHCRIWEGARERTGENYSALGSGEMKIYVVVRRSSFVRFYPAHVLNV